MSSLEISQQAAQDASQARIVDHPLVRHHLAALRDETTTSGEFRLLTHRLTCLLAFEATRDLSLSTKSVKTPMTTTECQVISQSIALVPILRAGLGMVEPMLTLLPEAVVWHLGFFRDEATALPVEYYAKSPAVRADVAFVLDPMLATGGSAIAALEKLSKWDVSRVKLLSIIAAKEGIAAVKSRCPQVDIYACVVDPTLNANKFIVPGLGDAGDRIFGT